MNTIYIGDRQLDPDDEWQCPHCGFTVSSQRALQLHVSRCPNNDDIDYPEPDPGEEV
jgi:ubiquitin C-terminal hydrolase